MGEVAADRAAGGGRLDVTEDAFLGDRLAVLQPKAGYRAGTDAVLLAASIAGEDGRQFSVLDVGAGVGVVGLCVAARLPACRVVLAEKNCDLAGLARDNVNRNGLGDRVEVVQTDVLAPAASSPLQPETFDHVVSNPPFYGGDAIRASANPLKADAHVMPDGGLERWLRFMARMTRPGGQASMIHVAERLDDVMAAFRGRFGGLVVQPLHSRAGAAANRVIVRGTKGSRRPLQLLAGIVLHGSDNGFRRDIDAVLRGPRGLPLADGSGTSTAD